MIRLAQSYGLASDELLKCIRYVLPRHTLFAYIYSYLSTQSNLEPCHRLPIFVYNRGALVDKVGQGKISEGEDADMLAMVLRWIAALFKDDVQATGRSQPEDDYEYVLASVPRPLYQSAPLYFMSFFVLQGYDHQK